jgi:hypothetical protein
MTVAIPMNMDALGREFVVVVVKHNHNKVKVYFYSRLCKPIFDSAVKRGTCREFGMLRWATREI